MFGYCHRCKYLKGKREKKGCENLGFVVFGVKWSPRKVSTVYRRRFAIESSYRMRNIVKPKTSTKNANIRYFYTLISFLLKNVWLYLQKKHFLIRTYARFSPYLYFPSRHQFIDSFLSLSTSFSSLCKFLYCSTTPLLIPVAYDISSTVILFPMSIFTLP